MSSNFESIDSDDIVDFPEGIVFIDRSPAFGSDLIARFKQAQGVYANNSDSVEQLIGEGLSCRILKPGSYWQEGRLKVYMKFEPNLPENSPLDEFRENT
jgi:hypothetical protein